MCSRISIVIMRRQREGEGEGGEGGEGGRRGKGRKLGWVEVYREEEIATSAEERERGNRETRRGRERWGRVKFGVFLGKEGGGGSEPHCASIFTIYFFYALP